MVLPRKLYFDSEILNWNILKYKMLRFYSNGIFPFIESHNDNKDKICLLDKTLGVEGLLKYTFNPRNGHTHQTLCEIVIF